MDVNSKITINDVAELSGVSPSTVSLVINNHPRISPATAQKVRAAAKKIGYEPGRASIRKGHRPKSRRPASYRKMQVALITQVKPMLLETPVYSKLLRGIADELGKMDYNLIIRNLPEENPEQAIPHKIDGAILFHVNAIQSNAKLFRELRRIPCVTVMGQAEEGEFFDHVTYNNRSIGKLAAEYLLSKDNKTFLFLGNRVPADNWFNLRGKDFISTVRKAGAKAYEILADNLIDESRNMQLPNVKNFCAAIEKMRQLPELPTAIFVLADIYISGLYHSLKHYDIIPGRDVEIVGVNNDSNMLNHLIPRPASVDIHPEDIGRKAVERLLWRIENPKEPLGKILIEPEMAFS
ncbi:MAG: LacI family DNA-binding transcriptional regulator [Lentisphaerota bacterium]